MTPFRDVRFVGEDDAASPKRAVAARQGRRQILVRTPQSEDSLLAQQLFQLNYEAIEARTYAPGFGRDQGPVAAIAEGSTAEALRFFASVPSGVPKVLISSDVSFDTRVAAARAQVDAVIEWPADLTELSDWLERFENRRTAPSIAVLLVDDDELTAELHAHILRSAGIEVCVVTDPAETIDAVAMNRPDLILMDVHMPDVNGIEVAQVIRQSNEYLLLPIVFLSAEKDTVRQITARRFGGDDFLVKPIDPKTLVSTIRLRAERSRSLRVLVERDGLTGLVNHARFKERVEQELSRARRTGSDGTFAMIDIDHFKQVNDRFGHQAGDKVIRTLARVLLGRLRATDVIGRYGGEEFGVFFPDVAPDETHMVLDAIRKSFADVVFEVPAGSFSVTFSAGLTAAGQAEAYEVIDAADTALYRAKMGGRNRIAGSETEDTSQPIDEEPSCR